MNYVCTVCGYVYDPETGDPDNGVVPGTAFADIQEDWLCPLCGVGKDSFEVEEQVPVPYKILVGEPFLAFMLPPFLQQNTGYRRFREDGKYVEQLTNRQIY